MKSPESQIFFIPADRGSSGSNHLSERQSSWYQQSMEAQSRFTPNLDDFSDIYPREEIEKDKARVERRKQDFARGGNEGNELRDFRARLEEFLFERLGRFWLGGEVIQTSEFDDYANGVDAVFEGVNEEGSVHRLGIDITTGGDEALRKLLDIGMKAKSGEFYDVKYLRSKAEKGFLGAAEMPRVVLGFSDIETVARQYYLLKSSTDLVVQERFKKMLMHPKFRLSLVTSVVVQLEGIRSALVDSGFDGPKVEVIDGLLAFFSNKKTALDKQVAALGADDPEYYNSVSSAISGWRP